MINIRIDLRKLGEQLAGGIRALFRSLGLQRDANL